MTTDDSNLDTGLDDISSEERQEVGRIREEVKNELRALINTRVLASKDRQENMVTIMGMAEAFEVALAMVLSQHLGNSAYYGQLTEEQQENNKTRVIQCCISSILYYIDEFLPGIIDLLEGKLSPEESLEESGITLKTSGDWN